MGTAENLIALLNTVTHDAEPAVRAPRRHALDRTFEAIERHSPLPLSDDDGLVIVISAHGTHWHFGLLAAQTYPFDSP